MEGLPLLLACQPPHCKKQRLYPALTLPLRDAPLNQILHYIYQFYNQQYSGNTTLPLVPSNRKPTYAPFSGLFSPIAHIFISVVMPSRGTNDWEGLTLLYFSRLYLVSARPRKRVFTVALQQMTPPLTLLQSSDDSKQA
ncbi:hypothetical protein FGO68_gene6546 [Halteria grandinella]|uniref:Uncharacterized protein n=1 Tax=Halteria grandinella TaxID=5974 RepID=A0A8J8SWD7_HALGN|nr:hypothetical protein FGO68_gene6546 [Halteria grandinella]